MNNSSDCGARVEAWQQAVSAVNALAETVRNLALDYSAAVAALRSALRSPDGERDALLLLSFLDVDYVLAVIDLLVSVALSHRHALRAREILGRVDRNELSSLIPPVLWSQLEKTSDYDAYRRLAELLSHLGLDDALQELCRRALDSADSDIREVGDDFIKR